MSLKKKYRLPPDWVLGVCVVEGAWFASTYEEPKDQKQLFGKSQNCQERTVGWGGGLATGVKGLPSPFWDVTYKKKDNLQHPRAGLELPDVPGRGGGGG